MHPSYLGGLCDFDHQCGFQACEEIPLVAGSIIGSYFEI